MRIRQYWLIIFLALGTAVFIFYKQQQDPITYHFAEDFDGNDYKHIYNYFTGTEENYVVEFLSSTNLSSFLQHKLTQEISFLIFSG